MGIRMIKRTFLVHLYVFERMNTTTSSEKTLTSFRWNTQLVERLRQMAKDSNSSLNNYVETLLLDIVYLEPNDETIEALEEVRCVFCNITCRIYSYYLYRGGQPAVSEAVRHRQGAVLKYHPLNALRVITPVSNFQDSSERMPKQMPLFETESLPCLLKIQCLTGKC